MFKRWKPEQKYLTKTLENTKGAIKTGQFRQTDNTGHTRRRNTKQKNNPKCVGHHYTNTNNVNNTCTFLQTTGDKDIDTIVFMWKL